MYPIDPLGCWWQDTWDISSLEGITYKAALNTLRRVFMWTWVSLLLGNAWEQDGGLEGRAVLRVQFTFVYLANLHFCAWEELKPL